MKESEGLEKKYLDIISTIILELDEKGVIKFINISGARILGHDRKEVIGKNWFKTFIPKGQRKEIRSVFNKIISGNIMPVRKYDNEVMTKKGDKKIIQWTNSYLKKGKKIVSVICSGTDITQRRVDEEVIRKAKEKYELLVEGTNDLIYSYELNGKISFVSANVSKYGYNTKDIIGKNLFSFVHPEDRGLAEKNIKKTINTGESYLTEIRFLNKDGSYSWVEEDSNLIKRGGKVVGVAGIVRDITKRKTAETKLQESQEILQKIIDLLPARIFWKDGDLNYLGCNDAFAHDAGKKSHKEMVGKNDYDMVWKEQAGLYQKDDKKVIESGVPKINYEEPQKTPKGDTIWLLTTKVPLTDDHGKTIGIRGNYIDITDKKKAAREVERFNEFSIGRELKMVELKEEVNRLLRKLNKPSKYDTEN